jgi:DNA polymerase V
MIESKIAAGHPIPGEDAYEERPLDFNEYLIKNDKASTYAMRVTGSSMVNAGICENDILVVDRSLMPKIGKIVVACVDGEFTVKRLCKRGLKYFLCAENPAYEDIDISQSFETAIWGVVTNVIKDL